MFRNRPVHMINEQHVRLAGFNPGRQHANPQVTGPHHANGGAVFRTFQFPVTITFHSPHEIIGNGDTVMQVQRLAIRIATGRTANLDELFNFRMADRQIDRRRTTSQ